MRPLWYEFPNKDELFGVDDEFMLGPGLLVKPITHVSNTQYSWTCLVWLLITVSTNQLTQLSATSAVCECSNTCKHTPGVKSMCACVDCDVLTVVCVCLQAGATKVDITLPAGVLWYESTAGQSVKVDKAGQVVSAAVNLESIPAFYRGGAVIPRR